MAEINTELSIGELIMRYAKLRGLSQAALREEYNQKFGTEYNQPAFSRKLIRGAIRWDELNHFGEILGFKVKLVSTD